ncbi:histidine phosphatase family protein [Nocardia abscessus]|uniref:histidine phosphatase family protein n=1 Tax=Nocardia abscessus TaxID=120957 RepID=UPI0020CFF5C6|nr:histidine phosphatase family protein [Nocardia abscessus]
MDRFKPEARSGARLLLIRCAHSESHDDGAAGRAGDRELSPTGRSQAARLAERLAAEQCTLEISHVYSTRLRRAAQTAAVVADVLGLSVHAELLGLAGAVLGESTQRLPSGDEPLVASAAVGEGEQTWEQRAPRVGRELELIAGKHPGETVVVICHQACILAATQHFLEATYSQAHASMEVDHTAITEWQLRPLDHKASGAEGLRWVLRRANDAEHLRPQLRRSTRRGRHS